MVQALLRDRSHYVARAPPSESTQQAMRTYFERQPAKYGDTGGDLRGEGMPQMRSTLQRHAQTGHASVAGETAMKS